MAGRTDHAVLAHWLQQERAARKEMDEALEQARMWLERARQAQQAGRTELALQARERGLQAREAHRNAEIRLQEAQVQQDAARRELRTPGGDAQLRADQIKANFEALGIDMEAAAFDGLEEQASANEALAALRRRMGGDEG